MQKQLNISGRLHIQSALLPAREAFDVFRKFCCGLRLLMIAVFFMGMTTTLWSQKKSGLTFERITTDVIRFEKGLSQNTVQCIIQDRHGFLWFGTWDGLNKYDGYSFSVWNEETGLSSQNIQALLEDRDGLIWIGTEDGLNVYDRSMDRILQYKHDHRNPNSLVHNRIRCLAMDRNGNIWIGTNRGISLYNKKQKRFENFRHDVSEAGSPGNSWINDIVCDDLGNVWIATFQGLDRFDPATRRFVHIGSYPFATDLNKVPVYCLAQHPDHSIWLGSEKGLYRLFEKEKTLEYFPVDQPENDDPQDYQIFDLLFDGKENLWIGTAGSGVIILETETKNYNRLRAQKDNPQSLSNDQIYSLFRDDAGLIWVGTYSGLNKYDRNSSKFRHYKQNPGDPGGLLSDVVFGFFEDSDGTIWIGSENGVNLFNPEKGTFSLLKDRNGKPTPLVNGLVRTFFKDQDGMMWIGSTGGLSRYNPALNTLKHYRPARDNPNSLVNNFVWKILEDKDGYLWIATERGLSRFDKKTEKFVNYLHDENNPYSLPDNVIFDLHIDRVSRLWVATSGGLCWFDPLKQRFYPAPGIGGNQLSSGQLRTSGIFEDPAGNFWISTFGGGLMKYNPGSGRYLFYTEKNGLPNNVVYKVIDDKGGNLWVPTNRGLARFNVANESFITYGLKDGIQSNEFNLGASLITSNGRIFFGGMNGFNTFFPDEIRKNEKPARIAISGFYVFDKLAFRELFDQDTIYLKHSENFFAFSFSSLDFANPAKNQYKYFLENFERGWNSTDAYDRLAEYTNVPPGRYRFRVKGSNNDGIWNDQGVAITLIIVPPWYSTWLFRGGMAALIILFLYIMVMNRLKRINKKHQIEKQFLEMERQYADLEQKALRLQMNPHFIFNTLNSIQSYMINNDSDTAIEYLAKFARLMRQVLANSRESFIPVKEELVALKYYLEIEQLRFDDKFSYSIHLDKDIDEEFTGIPPMVLQPYVENAIIHGLMYKKDKGVVSISLDQKRDCILCVIEDDGVGRERAMQIARESGLERKSSGMMITQQRLDILNKSSEEELKVKVIDKLDEDGTPCGTRVEIKMPFIEI